MAVSKLVVHPHDHVAGWELQLTALPSLMRENPHERLPSPPPGDLPNPGIELRSPTLQADSLPSEAPGKTRVQSLGQEDPLEKEMATHSSILAWRIP